MPNIENAILATLVYYDVLNKPLTAWEVFKYLIRPPQERESQRKEVKFSDILTTLENSDFLTQKIGKKNGFFFLKDRQDIVQQRIERQKEAERKWKKSRRVINFLQLIPFIRLVLISGSLAQNNTSEKSDIDLLIVAKAGHIWTVRGLVTAFLHLIGQRRHGPYIENRFCLNHYLTDDSLEIKAQSLYNAQTYAHLTAIWQEKESYQSFQQANNWLKNYLFFYPMAERGYLREIHSNQLFHILRKMEEFVLSNWFGDALENILRKTQIKKISRKSEMCQSGGRVVFNDKQLEFHPHSPEKNIITRYNQKMRELGLFKLANEQDSGLTP